MSDELLLSDLTEMKEIFKTIQLNSEHRIPKPFVKGYRSGPLICPTNYTCLGLWSAVQLQCSSKLSIKISYEVLNFGISDCLVQVK